MYEEMQGSLEACRREKEESITGDLAKNLSREEKEVRACRTWQSIMCR